MKKTDKPTEKKSPVGYILYRYSVVLSAVLAVVSVFSDLGTRIGNRLWMKSEQVASSDMNKALLPYESPSFHVFDGVFISDAKASASR
jgi:hypothetical protein